MDKKGEAGIRWSLYFRKQDALYLEKLRDIARKSDRSVNALVLRAIREFVSGFESGARNIRELK